jgi:hypothetical protein
MDMITILAGLTPESQARPAIAAFEIFAAPSEGCRVLTPEREGREAHRQRFVELLTRGARRISERVLILGTVAIRRNRAHRMRRSGRGRNRSPVVIA